MKIFLRHIKELQETEIEIKYQKMSDKISHMVSYLRQYDVILEGVDENKIFQIPLEKVCYIETTDRKTYIYIDKLVYESRKTIQTLEGALESTTIVRIGKSTLLNISKVKSVRPYPNHRLLLELDNGEKLIVSRRYIENFRERIRREYGA